MARGKKPAKAKRGELDPKLREEFCKFLRQRVKKACKEKGVQSYGSATIDLSTPGGMIIILAGLETIEDDPKPGKENGK